MESTNVFFMVWEAGGPCGPKRCPGTPWDTLEAPKMDSMSLKGYQKVNDDEPDLRNLHGNC